MKKIMIEVLDDWYEALAAEYDKAKVFAQQYQWPMETKEAFISRYVSDLLRFETVDFYMECLLEDNSHLIERKK